DPRQRLELRLRWQVGRRRDLHLLPAQEDRLARARDDPYGAQRRLHDQAGHAVKLAGTMRRWPLRRRLIVGATLLVLITLLLSAAATVFALRASLDARLNRDVQVGLDLAAKPGPGDPGSDAPSGSG